jgi:hypothetical protein
MPSRAYSASLKDLDGVEQQAKRICQENQKDKSDNEANTMSGLVRQDPKLEARFGGQKTQGQFTRVHYELSNGAIQHSRWYGVYAWEAGATLRVKLQDFEWWERDGWWKRNSYSRYPHDIAARYFGRLRIMLESLDEDWIEEKRILRWGTENAIEPWRVYSALEMEEAIREELDVLTPLNTADCRLEMVYDNEASSTSDDPDLSQK